MSQPPASPSTSGQRRRFRWPVRVLLFCVLFHMFFRSTDVLYPWEDWLYELKIRRMPRRLPTRALLDRKRAEAGGSSAPVVKEFRDCAASLPGYWCPWPRGATREQLTSRRAWLKYSLAWTASRLQWCECVLSIDQEWPMFAPNVSRKKYPARARLIFADGTEITVRQRSDPEDLTRYTRWGQGKNLGYDRMVASDSGQRWEACRGYCHFLAHRHPANSDGSPLREIRLYHVTYELVPPGADPEPFLRHQMERTVDHTSPGAWKTFFIYYPDTRESQFLP